MRSTVAGRAPGTTSGTVVLTWLKPTLDASTAMSAIIVTHCAVMISPSSLAEFRAVCGTASMYDVPREYRTWSL